MFPQTETGSSGSFSGLGKAAKSHTVYPQVCTIDMGKVHNSSRRPEDYSTTYRTNTTSGRLMPSCLAVFLSSGLIEERKVDVCFSCLDPLKYNSGTRNQFQCFLNVLFIMSPSNQGLVLDLGHQVLAINDQIEQKEQAPDLVPCRVRVEYH